MTKPGRAAAALAGCAVLVLAGCGAERVAGRARPLASKPDVSAIQLQNTTSVSLRKSFNESPQAVNAYWTTKRIDGAQPKQPGAPIQPPTPSTPAPGSPRPSTPAPINPTPTRPVVPPSTQKPVPKAPPANTVIAPTRGTPKNVLLTNDTAGGKWSRTGLTGSTAGRLYFEVGGQDFVCSATVVHSRSQDIVATAGHCVWDTETGKGWSQKLLFVPGDADNADTAPYGRWTVQRMWASNSFIKNAKATSGGTSGTGWQVDFAFMKMDKLNGRKIQSVTGGQGIAFGLDVNSILDLGYPTAPPFNGTSERYCSAHAWDISSDQYYDRVIACAMTPGCSGGGWLTDYNPADGAGYLIGVNSVGGKGYMFSAQFGDAALSAYNDATANRH